MILVSNTVPQTVPAGGVLTFNTVVAKDGCRECNKGTRQSIKLCKRGTYIVSFSANVSGATAGTPVQLNIQLGGENRPETTMISTPAGANELNNVSTTTAIERCCCDFDRVSVVNTGTTDITIGANPAFLIREK